MTVTLPWPPAELSPNARNHWRVVHRAKTAYKDLCSWALLGQPKAKITHNDRIPITVILYPPDNRRRDRDNMQSSLKYALDCVARRIGVDDYRFDPTYRFAEPEKPGRVEVVIG
jgi:crossover junction endodeoxyribonuclease RusA